MIRRSYLACAIQMNTQPDAGASFAEAEALVAKAAARGAELVGLPENFPRICETQEEAASFVHEDYPAAERRLCDMAARHRIVLYGGVIMPAEGGRVRNTLVVAGKDGAVIARYHKRHLFDVFLGGKNTLQESKTVEPGEEAVVVDLGDMGVLGLSICYDLRFPEHFRALVDAGAEILTVPAAFLTATGQDHWHALLRARAIENTCYVLAPAQGGRHNARRASYGHALVIDPWGHVLADTGDRSGLAMAEIDPERLAQVRSALPCLAHRLPEGRVTNCP